MSSPGQTNDNLEATRKQVDEVQNIMKANVEKVLERDGKLSALVRSGQDEHKIND